MPVIVNSVAEHPFLPSLGSPSAIERERALRQDIRPLEIAIVNLMADKQTTERQLALWLGNTPLQVKLTFAATDSYVRDVHNGRSSANTPAEHILRFYKSWSAIKSRKFDGLIVTGVNALKERVEFESYWPEVQRILDWSSSNVFSSLFLCWGAKAALKHFHNIDSLRSESKTFGLFNHRIKTDSTNLLFGFPDEFLVPVARWKNPDTQAIVACDKLEVIATCEETGPNILAEPVLYESGSAKYPRRIYVLNHPEYDTDTLKNEYLRDKPNLPTLQVPKNYFPDNDPKCQPVNRWRHTAQIYTNWVKAIYAAAPYELDVIPRPWKA